jgi:hypothetical protein
MNVSQSFLVPDASGTIADDVVGFVPVLVLLVCGGTLVIVPAHDVKPVESFARSSPGFPGYVLTILTSASDISLERTRDVLSPTG